MAYIKYFFGAILWRVRAAWWYLTLGFRLYFAIGLDRDFDPSKEDAVKESFVCPIPRSYRRHINKPVSD